jgi:hypothetical protein
MRLMPLLIWNFLMWGSVVKPVKPSVVGKLNWFIFEAGNRKLSSSTIVRFRLYTVMIRNPDRPVFEWSFSRQFLCPVFEW